MNSIFFRRSVNFFLMYTKVWYSVWALLALVSLIGAFFLGGIFEINNSSFFLSSILLLIKAFTYFKIADYLKMIFFNQVAKSKNIFKLLSISFAVLFVIDLISYRNFKSSRETDDLYSRFLDVSTAGSTLDEVIKLCFKYFPLLYDLFSPRVEGITLFIIAIALHYFSTSKKTD